MKRQFTLYGVPMADPAIHSPGTYAAVRTPYNGRLYVRVYSDLGITLLRKDHDVLYLVRVKGRQNGNSAQ